MTRVLLTTFEPNARATQTHVNKQDHIRAGSYPAKEANRVGGHLLNRVAHLQMVYPLRGYHTGSTENPTAQQQNPLTV